MNINARKYSLLIANNDENSIQLFNTVLEEYNYQVTTLNTFPKIYEFYKQKRYDVVILTNLGLLPGDIIVYIKKLKKIDPEINLLVLSGTGDSKFIRTLADLGLETFYGLPINFDELHSRIQLLLKNKLFSVPVDKEYLIISPPGKEYTSKWCLEAHFTCFFPEELEGEREFSLLDFTAYKFAKSNYLDPRRYRKPLGGKIILYGNSSRDGLYDIYAYRLKKLNEINDTQLFHLIYDWEQKVRNKINNLHPQNNPCIEFFVKVFTFIRLGYSTKYQLLAEIFSLPFSLYSTFEEEYDNYIAH